MAHLPRWIDDSRVDSQAMLSAVLWFQNQHPDQYKFKRLDELFMIDHKSYVIDLNNGRSYKRPWKACMEHGYKRCAKGEGGYQFRWYDARWYARYVELARKGSPKWLGWGFDWYLERRSFLKVNFDVRV